MPFSYFSFSGGMLLQVENNNMSFVVDPWSFVTEKELQTEKGADLYDSIK